MSDWPLPILLAPIIGSFLGVLILRLPEGRPVGMARSACETCGHGLGWRDLVPLLSYARLAGACRYCRAPIGRLHLGIELAALAVAGVAALLTPDDPVLWLSCGLGWALLALAWIDARHMLLPDALTLPLILAGLGVTLWLVPEDLADHALGAALGYLGFRLIDVAYARWRGRAGLGQGDAKLLAAAGAWVGAAALPLIILIAALSALVFVGLTVLRGAQVGVTTAIPFGPFLALAFWGVWMALR